MNEITITLPGFVMLCATMGGIGACVAHWVDTRWPSSDKEGGEE